MFSSCHITWKWFRWVHFILYAINNEVKQSSMDFFIQESFLLGWIHQVILSLGFISLRIQLVCIGSFQILFSHYQSSRFELDIWIVGRCLELTLWVILNLKEVNHPVKQTSRLAQIVLGSFCPVQLLRQQFWPARW